MKNKIPVGWQSQEIGGICRLINGKAFKPEDWSKSGLPIIRIQNLNKVDAPFNYFQGIPEAKYLVENGQLLFAWSGTPGTSFGAHVWDGPTGVLNQHIFKIEFDEKLLDKTFFRHAINQKLNELIGSAQGGVGLRHVTKGTFEKTKIIFPSLIEQKRIVAKLDSLLARVESCRAHLDRAAAAIKRFRQSLLNAAVTGKLTDQWRKEFYILHKSSLLSADLLLRKIAEEKKAKKIKVRSRRNDFDIKGLSDNIDLPEGWSVSCFDELAAPEENALKAGPFGSSLKKEMYAESGYKIYGQEQVISGDENLGNYFIDAAKFKELSSCSVKSGDILISLVGTIGKVLILSDKAKPGIINPRLVKLSLHEMICRDYIAIYLGSQVAQHYLSQKSHGGTMDILNLGILRELPILLPPPEEQVEISKGVKKAFAKLEKMEMKIQSASAQCESLTASILAKAFRGELV